MEKKLEFTDRAKDQIKKITKSEAKKYFRIAVQGGGCSGFKYNFSFDDEKTKNRCENVPKPSENASKRLENCSKMF